MSAIYKGLWRNKTLLLMLILLGFLVLNGCTYKEAPTAKPTVNLLQTNITRRAHSLPPSAEILFVSNRGVERDKREIYSMDAEGGYVTRITFTNQQHFIFGIDNSRKYLVVTRVDKVENKVEKSLWILDLETGEEKRLTKPGNNAEGDSFSPSGEWVVFQMKLSKSRQSDIYKIRRDGTRLTRLTYTEEMYESDPAWSNDGKHILFISLNISKPHFVLEVMDTNGSNVRTIYDGEDNVSTPCFPPGVYDPSWSPDDQWIIFEKPVHYNRENGGAGVWHIFKIRSDGTNLIDLSESGGHVDWAEYTPSFSNNGEFVVFSARYSLFNSSKANIDIFEMDRQGKLLKKLTNDKFYNEFPIWVK